MGWLSELGFSLEFSESWQEFLIWTGWNSYNQLPDRTRKACFILLPTTRSTAAFVAFGYLMRQSSESGEVQLLKLNELSVGACVFFRRSTILAGGKAKTGIYSGEVVQGADPSYDKMVAVKKRIDGKNNLKGVRYWSAQRKFALSPLQKLAASEATAFLEAFGYTDATGSYLSTPSVVDVLSSNKKQLLDDLMSVTLTARHPDTKQKASCRIETLLACRGSVHRATNIRSGRYFLPDEDTTSRCVILDGETAFLNNDLWSLNADSIVILMSQQEYSSVEVRRRLESLLEKRSTSTDCGTMLMFENRHRMPEGVDGLNICLKGCNHA